MIINIDEAIHLISIRRAFDSNDRHYFYLDGILLYLSVNDSTASTDKVKMLLEIYVYDFIENNGYVYTMIKYSISDNNFNFMESTYNSYIKLIANISDLSKEEQLSHNKVIDDYFKPFYYKMKRRNKIFKILNG